MGFRALASPPGIFGEGFFLKLELLNAVNSGAAVLHQ